MGIFHSVKLYRTPDSVVIKIDRVTNYVLIKNELKQNVKGLDYKKMELMRTVKTTGTIHYRVYICDDGCNIIDIQGTNTKIGPKTCVYDPTIDHKVQFGKFSQGTDNLRFGGSIYAFHYHIGK